MKDPWHWTRRRGLSYKGKSEPNEIHVDEQHNRPGDIHEWLRDEVRSWSRRVRHDE